MPVGLQTFDESGNILLDTSDRLCRYLNTFRIKKGKQFIAIEKQEKEQFWWFFVNRFKNINGIQEVHNGIWVESSGEQIMVVGVY